jgi:hypothetical protein
MGEWERLSSVELGKLIQRLYMRLEQYEIHAASLVEGSHEREGASALVERLRKRVIDMSGALDRRIAHAMGLDAHTRAVRIVPSATTSDDTSGNTRGRVA